MQGTVFSVVALGVFRMSVRKLMRTDIIHENDYLRNLYLSLAYVLKCFLHQISQVSIDQVQNVPDIEV